MHSDHYGGLTTAFDLGPVFCSPVTKAIMLLHFPRVQESHAFPVNSPFHLNLLTRKVEDSDLIGYVEHPYIVKVTFYDSNHCPGSVMVLLEGYMGRVLHTGDMRYCPSMQRLPLA